MYEFQLNGKPTLVEEEMSLLDYLREINLTSVKNGCSGGTCGACTVLIDGKAVRACLSTTAKANGKSIVTLEGLTPFEKEVFDWSFTEAGAVQCGFCTPGMVMSAKALLDTTLEPSSEQIKRAIRGNVCRCTGYVKIIQAIELAGKALKTKTIPKTTFLGKVGERYPRLDAKDKILGLAKYVDDLKMAGMIYGGALRAKYPRAIIKKIDITEALKHPLVEAIVLAADIPGSRFLGHLVQDWPALIAIGEETRYIGDAVALVAAQTKAALKEILNLIEVEYEELTPLTSPLMALADSAPKLHPNGNTLRVERVHRGDVDKAFQTSKYVVKQEYTTPFTEHAFLEPESALAFMENDIVNINTGSQSVYDENREIAHLLGLPKEKVRTMSQTVGGAFGGKEDMSVQHHAALLTWITKKPVKVTLSRQESINVHPKRHAMAIQVTTSCDETGHLTGFKANIISDTGAYASLGGPVLQRACTHAAGPYRIPNVEIMGTAVYTNNPPGGAFRGFGVTQSVFASECNLNLLAEQVGISPWEIRYRNAILPGEVLPNGQIADASTAIIETLESVKSFYEESQYAGIACAMKNAGLGVGVPDFGRCRIKIIAGKAHVYTSAARVGQGLSTIVAQMVGEATHLSPDKIVLESPDTYLTPNSGTSTASRQTLFTGEASRLAGLKLYARLLNKTLQDIEGEEFYGEYEGITDPMNSSKEFPVSHIAYSYATQVVRIDETGKLLTVLASHDVGRAINPKNVEGQIEGGVVMGLGYALTEDFPLENAIPKVKFGTLGLFRATDIPEIQSIIIEKNSNELAYGAKGIGEITTIPTAPAVQGAYYQLDHTFRTVLPLEHTFYKNKN